MTSYEPTHFKKMVRAWKTKITIILFKTRPTNGFLKAKSYNFHFHKNDVTWPLSANGLLFIWFFVKESVAKVQIIIRFWETAHLPLP